MYSVFSFKMLVVIFGILINFCFFPSHYCMNQGDEMINEDNSTEYTLHAEDSVHGNFVSRLNLADKFR